MTRRRDELEDRSSELTARLSANRENSRHGGTPKLDAEFKQLFGEALDVEKKLERLDTLDGKLEQRDELLDSAESQLTLIKNARGPERRYLQEGLEAILADVEELNDEIAPLQEAEHRDATMWRRYGQDACRQLRRLGIR